MSFGFKKLDIFTLFIQFGALAPYTPASTNFVQTEWNDTTTEVLMDFHEMEM